MRKTENIGRKDRQVEDRLVEERIRRGMNDWQKGRRKERKKTTGLILPKDFHYGSYSFS